MADNVTHSTSAAVDFVAGTVGGIASLLAGHPFDTIKTRLQAQSQAPASPIKPTHLAPSSSATNAATEAAAASSSSRTPLLSSNLKPQATFHYSSSVDALRRIVAEERFLGLYKGVTSPMLGVAVMNASIFGVYGIALRHLQDQAGDSQANLGDIFVAGCASGVISAFITAPIDLIKIRQQLSGIHSSQQKGTLEVIRGIWSTEGRLRGMYRGLGSTCIRDLGYGPYFFSYELLNRYLLSLKSDTTGGLSNMETALSGGMAGVVAWVSTFGADVVKTRVQASSDSRSSRGRSAFVSAARDTFREGGWRAFFAGIGPTILRALPVNAVLFISYEATKDLLTRRGY